MGEERGSKGCAGGDWGWGWDLIDTSIGGSCLNGSFEESDRLLHLPSLSLGAGPCLHHMCVARGCLQGNMGQREKG